MKRILLFFATSLLVLLPASAQKIPELKGYVNDYAGVISSSEEREINALLSSLEKSGVAQIAVLTVDDLQGHEIESYSIKAADQWKLGQKDRDNGILFLLALDEKKVRIEVGYGLEGTMTDAKSGYIIRNVIIPEFKRGNFGNGLYKGVDAVSSVLGGTMVITDKDIAESERSSRRSSSGGLSLNVIIFIIIFILSSLTRGRRRRGGLFQALFWGSMLSGGSRRGGGFSGGGGFGGGGFSGGGGGFGGGGASGGW